MLRVLYCALAAVSVWVIAVSEVPDTVNPKQAARAWYELGLTHARQGEYGLARACFTSVREIAPTDSLIWSKATMALAVSCEADGRLDEASYYFASNEAKHGEYANRLRSEFKGAWHNLRSIVEKEKGI